MNAQRLSAPPHAEQDEQQLRELDEFIRFSRSGQQTSIQHAPWRSPETEQHLSARDRALTLLSHAMHKEGADGDCIPSADALGWSPTTRQKAVDSLRPYVFSIKRGNRGGVFVDPQQGHETLMAILEAVLSGAIRPLTAAEIRARKELQREGAAPNAKVRRVMDADPGADVIEGEFVAAAAS